MWRPLRHPALLRQLIAKLLLIGLLLALPTLTVAAAGETQRAAAHFNVADILHFIHERQHPASSACASRRLLLLHFPASTLRGDGLGQLLLRITAGLGEAMHAGRTLIWGLELPHILEALRPSHSPCADDRCELPLNCSGAHAIGSSSSGGGAFNCLFAPLSSCSISDVTQAELAALGAGGGYRDSARVRVQEARRAPAVFVPPARFRDPDGQLTLRHRWAGALAAYVSRLTPGVHAVFEARREALGLVHGSFWGLHVRHGDVAAEPERYGSRRVYSFRAFFDAAAETAAAAAASAIPAGALNGSSTAGTRTLPSVLFVSSDAASTAGAVRAARGWFASGAVSWPAGAWRPRIVTVANQHRLRTLGGAHVAAFTHAHAGRVAPLLRVLMEAAEDLHLLSHSELLIAQGNSGFSAFAALLVAARTDGSSPPVFLDHAELASGELQSGVVTGTFSQFATASLDRGHERWSEFEARFTCAPMLSFIHAGGSSGGTSGGLRDRQQDVAVFARLLPSAPHTVFAPDGLPLMSAAVFDAEARCWVPPHAAECDDACPRLLPESAAEAATSLSIAGDFGTPAAAASSSAAAAAGVDPSGDVVITSAVAATSTAAAAGATPLLVARAALFMRRGNAWARRLPSKALSCWAAEAAALDACAASSACVGAVDAAAVAHARGDVGARIERLVQEHLWPYAQQL